ncbi:MAG: L,D-transpeptidase family protein [Thermoleophilaceae bacterium]
MSRPTIAIVAALAALALTAPAVAAQETTPTATTPAPPPPEEVEPEPGSEPKGGKASIDVDDGVATRKLRYVAYRDTIVVRGKVRPFVRGQVAVLHVRRKGRPVGRKRARIRRAKNGAGKVAFKLKMRRKGLFRLSIRHRATARQRAFKSEPVRVRAIATSAGEGARGTRVLLLQRGLKRLGFAVPVTGHYDAGTSRAVIAFRKANGMERIGYASSTVYSMVLRGEGAFEPKFPRAGYHVEYDWSRQVLAFVRNGRTWRAYHSSSGTAATPTVFGTFTFYRKEPGTNHLGMVQSNYFIRGYAIHGYHSVPIYPASHGCLRVPIPNAYQIDRQISLGMKIMVYR